MFTIIKNLIPRIYNLKNHREVRRAIIFAIRFIIYRKELEQLFSFLNNSEAKRKIYSINPFPIEQATRAFFYSGSTLAKRLDLIKGHFDYLESTLVPAAFIPINTFNPYQIWQSDDDDINWRAYLRFDPGQRKEGLLSLIMDVDYEHLYQIIFWLGIYGNEPYLTIGAMQGPNTNNAQDFIREMTKRSHRFRTKNLILYMLMAVARALGVKHIYAVTNSGYYANNHIRLDRKLKTDFNDFWQEIGGSATDDKRFYELPLTLHRKANEDIPTRKRAVYRRRFAFLDDIDSKITSAVELLKQ